MKKAITMKKLFTVTAAAVVGSLLLVAFAPGMIGSSRAADAGTQAATKRTLSVSGEGLIKVTPDLANIMTGVVTEDTNAKTAQQKNAAAMSKVVAAIRGAGVKDEDIKTVSYNISPKYNYNKDTGESRIIGYTVTNTVQVVVRDTSKAGNILDLAASNGANLAGNISFSVSDYDKYYNEALKKACDAARKKAESMAGVFGITLKLPISIAESGSPSQPMPMYAGSYAKADMEAITPVQSGTMEVKANVSVVYEY